MPTFTTSDGISLHYTDDGSGLPLLCLAGLTRNGRDFDFVAPHLQNVRLIRLDYRGRGKSEWADPETYTIPVEARDAVELLDHLGIENAAILGSSRGGLIAMVLASTAKDRLLGVALNDIGPEIAPEGLAAIKDYIGKPPRAKTLEDAASARATAMAGFRNVPHERWLQEADILFRETPDGLDLTYDPRLRDAVLRDGAQPAADLWPLFDALAGLPLATIRGENSDLLTEGTFNKMKDRRPDMIAATVPDRGHIPFLDEPESLNALRRWLDMLR
ncbi:alpha/beta hydrolase [Marivita sp. GX14005]|uniref:alpha/beta fold hydrolase n=1 Tax=Marivita sp. GX14005 TaxID=2942276 RepID=UPI002018EF19|nr:alpha/beta hydrolase [Marivita sp. GX14005]MCL3880980.1 alpha/beta hydrolase [Marivita sp. GX14005]